MTAREYARCDDCGKIVYRELGKLHGDGQLDTDESPVWLLGSKDDLPADATVPFVRCGCIEH